MKTLAEFTKLLKTAIGQLTNGKANIFKCACFAIQHYAKHGDHGCLNQVLQALLTAKIGGQYYRQWVEAYTDQRWSSEEKKFVKDHSIKTGVDVANAIKNNFFDGMAKDSEIKVYVTDDVLKAINNVVARFSNSEKFEAKNSNALKTVNDLQAFVQKQVA